jgi:dihydrofolate reductase
MISIIVAADLNRAIGAHNRIPWRLRSDLVRLKELTLGQTVILGRKSYDSMVGYYDKSGRPMPGKMYVVVTRDDTYQPVRENARAVHSIDEAVTGTRTSDNDKVFVIGGGDIFKAFLPLADRVYLTEVQTKITDADAHFPIISSDDWVESSRVHHVKDDRNEFDYDVITYNRR